MRRENWAKAYDHVRVSIHASVKDATSTCQLRLYYQEVSIHASVKDATLECEDFARRVRVSIHASVKDATIVQII